MDHGSSDGGAPDGAVALAAGVVDGPHPVDGLADAAARPVERRRAHVPGLLLPLAVCGRSQKSAAACTCSLQLSHARRGREADSCTYLVAWRSRGSDRRRARPPARGATRRGTRPRWRTGAGSACSSKRRLTVSARRARLCARTGRRDVDGRRRCQIRNTSLLAYWFMEMYEARSLETA